MKFDSEIHEGYLMAILESFTTIFSKLCSLDDIRWIMTRLNQWVDGEIEYRTRNKK